MVSIGGARRAAKESSGCGESISHGISGGNGGIGRRHCIAGVGEADGLQTERSPGDPPTTHGTPPHGQFDANGQMVIIEEGEGGDSISPLNPDLN